jgi:hypothetical protein
VASRQNDELQDVPPGRAGSAVLFVVMFAVMVGGFALMSYAFELGSPLLFSAGLLLSCAAFYIPMQLLSRPS